MGLRIVVASVELWDDVVAVRSTVVTDGDPIFVPGGDRFVPRLAESVAPLELRDDAGTTYHRHGGGGGAGGRSDSVHAVWTYVAFEPAVPGSARVLTVTTSGATAALDIPLVA